MQIRSIEFFDYKSFKRFTISARKRNIFVGPNNAGKSTALDALRIAFDALRFARRRKAVIKSQGDYGVCSTYFIPESVVQVDLRYCVRDFEDTNAKIEITALNGNKFVIILRPSEDLECFLVTESVPQTGTQFIQKQFPLQIVSVPTLSPLEENEERVEIETIERNQFGRLASRNFRNYWLHRSEQEFLEFSDLVSAGWPSVKLIRPEIERGSRIFVRMYFRDGPHVREVQWAGFGFQVWMQSMMHVMRANYSSIVVLDEPDIYLHPDMQHRLMSLISARCEQFFVATHSTEIINAADAGDVLIVRQEARAAKRIQSESEYAEIYTALGSSENAQFARLAKTKRVLFFEGDDRKLLQRLIKKFAGIDIVLDVPVTFMKTEGFSNWNKVSNTSWVFDKILGMNVQVIALFDRDYRCNEEVSEFQEKMKMGGSHCFVLPFKEIENALIDLSAIRKVVKKFSTIPESLGDLDDIEQEMNRLFTEARGAVYSLKLGHFIKHKLSRNPKMDVPTLSSEYDKIFSKDWLDIEFRRSAVPGKSIFSALTEYVQKKYKVTLTHARVIDALETQAVDQDLRQIIAQIHSLLLQ